MHRRLTCLLIAGLMLVASVHPEATAARQETGSGENEALTFLLMGLDRREGEPIESGVRPDVLAVLRLDPAQGACRLLSIPRDSRVTIPGHGESKINHAYALGGSELAIDTTEAFLGIPIDHYAALDMEGAAALIDAVGGVTIAEPEQFTSGAYTYESSPQTLTGEEAVDYARYRGGPDGDFGRIRRQQQVLQALLAGEIELDPRTVLLELAPTLAQHFRSDLTVPDLLAIALVSGGSCTGEGFDSAVIEGTPTTGYDEVYDQDLAMVDVDPAEIAAKVAWLLEGEVATRG